MTDSADQKELEVLRLVAEFAARCCIDLEANNASAIKEHLAGQIANGARIHVQNRMDSLYVALFNAGYTEKHKFFDWPQKPEPLHES